MGTGILKVRQNTHVTFWRIPDSSGYSNARRELKSACEIVWTPDDAPVPQCALILGVFLF